VLCALFVVPFFLGACTSSDASPSSPTATAEPAQATPTAQPATSSLTLDPPEPNGNRIRDIVTKLSVDIGLRQAGTGKEREAAEYIAGQLRSYGYEVEVQEFDISREASREASLQVRSSESRSIDAIPLTNSPSATVGGRVVFGGLGTPEAIAQEARGALVLMERGDLQFQEKVQNAQAAGALGAIIFNNQPGNFLGSMASATSIPAVAISQEQGQSLLQHIRSGARLEMDLSVKPVEHATSQNVIARPPGQECETVSGGHYDGIVGPGASDNATGTATMLEVAAILATRGAMSSNCFVLWGAEEFGLLGSKAYVASLDPEERARLRAVLNFDMVGVGDENWLLVGSPELTQKASALAQSLGMEVQAGNLPSNTSSDHASFIAAGIPALMLHRQDDNLLHTPQDVVDRVRPELLEEAARLGVSMLESLNGSS
jgi:aminopeptidase YwaD